ncbi:hypothetical protein [Loigolactobacillus bifermentans]|uniref:Uncharacterized protein n=1 Tax=Loigolactobacillus bifermentans DSM 20003 TaxID=1423726 RepID=A0A0R1GEW8_9LACO|nr:hypothetical protein [Loigolactobacillus bifermentans]KRK32780.1 hypothetical protein FC07_GL001833 [Loigolactobacillus bifermentans DSM 20003]QGG59435.1 hypothetical protein LB003_02535 [Loigolactobacillus bifermentans]
MTDEQWLDLNEIADYIETTMGANTISNSTLRRWINEEVALGGPDEVKEFRTSDLGSKKPVTKYQLTVVNSMINHNLSRIKKKVTHLKNEFPLALQQQPVAGDLQQIQATLQQQSEVLGRLEAVAKQQASQQLWLQIAQLQLNFESKGQKLDAKSLYADMLQNDMHDTIDQYTTPVDTGDLFQAIDDQQSHGHYQRTPTNNQKLEGGLFDD